MNDMYIFLYLLLVTALFIVLYLFIRFVLSEKRSFTFEIISIPLGIFKFDKRDEFLKVKNNEANKPLDKLEIENDKTFSADKIERENTAQGISLITDIDEMDSNKRADIIEETAKEEYEDKLLSENIKPSEYNTDILKKFEDEYNEEDIVYWTASGKAYHTSKKCRTLSRSKVIFNGTIEDSGRFVKCIHCR
ncbi:hypothetical protein [uncultured Clostridium sp.]|uniref:hypothetical protein n=1 Tax=uncultured Clostridium sp. TaxID=59620 RepID=UPI0025FC515C|nr:hypothetical protein [uncultured Clostridium sp.]